MIGKNLISVFLTTIFAAVMINAEEIPREVTAFEPAGGVIVILDSPGKLLVTMGVNTGDVNTVATSVTEFAVSPDGSKMIYNVKKGTHTADNEVWVSEIPISNNRKISDYGGYLFKWDRGSQKAYYCPEDKRDRLEMVDFITGEKKRVELK